MTSALARAVEAAERWHSGQMRKAGGAPYVSHLLQVAGLVLEHGGSEDQAIAALLHDALEDTAATRSQIEAAFGAEVADIVEACTDTLPGDTPASKSPWADRKARYLEGLRTVPEAAALVVACDKLHNLRGLVAEVRQGGATAISPPRFSASPADQVDYYEKVVGALGAKLPARLVEELEGLVGELRSGVSPSRDGGGSPRR